MNKDFRPSEERSPTSPPGSPASLELLQSHSVAGRVRSVLYVICLGLAIALVVVWWSELVVLWRDHVITLFAAVVIMLVAQVVQTVNFLAFFRVDLGVRLREFVQAWSASALVNYLGPFQPGIAVRMAYLYRRGVPISESALATLRQTAASLWVALLGLALGAFAAGVPPAAWLPALALALVAAVPWLRRTGFALLERLVGSVGLSAKVRWLAAAANGYSPQGLIGVVAQYALGTALLYFVYRQFGAAIELQHALILACAVYASSVVALLPANFGIAEAIYFAGGQNLGLTVPQAAGLALLLRAAHVLACVLLVFICQIGKGRGPIRGEKP